MSTTFDIVVDDPEMDLNGFLQGLGYTVKSRTRNTGSGIWTITVTETLNTGQKAGLETAYANITKKVRFK